MRGDEHYREAERLLQLAESTDWTTPQEPYRDVAIAAAQAHATLAHAAAVIDAADHADRAYPGTPWGRALYGDRHLTSNDKDS